MRTAVRAFRLLVSLLLVAALVEQGVLSSATTVAKQDGGEPTGAAGRADPLGWPGSLNQLVATATAAPGEVEILQPVDDPGLPATPIARAPTPEPLTCDDPEQILAPISAASEPTPIPLYEPLPYRTGELVAVSNTNGHGANFRVAPRALARVWRVVPEGEVLEIVGADEQVDRLRWAYVRDAVGTVGWIVSHQLTTVGLGPGNPPLPPRPRGFVPCPEAIPTLTPGVIAVPGGITIQINIQATPTPGR